nr:MAG TPA: hypothetical protein [Bacteriophage sp.]
MRFFSIVIVGFFDGLYYIFGCFCDAYRRFFGFLVWFLCTPPCIVDERVVICVINY